MPVDTRVGLPSKLHHASPAFRKNEWKSITAKRMRGQKWNCTPTRENINNDRGIRDLKAHNALRQVSRLTVLLASIQTVMMAYDFQRLIEDIQDGKLGKFPPSFVTKPQFFGG